MISDQIKQAILESGKTVYQISQETGVTNPVLSRFLSNDPKSHRDIRLEKTADKLAAYFGLTLSPATEADKPKPKDKVKAPAMPAVDWAKTEPKKKPKDEGRERGRRK